MKIKMLVTDLDGTLLRDDKTISARTFAALAACRARGIKVVYATGRGGSAEQRVPSACVDARIQMNGAVAFIGDERVYERLVPVESVREMLLVGTQRGYKMTAELCGWHYSNFRVSDVWAGMDNFELADFSTLSLDAEKLYAVADTPEVVPFIETHLPRGFYLTVSRDGLAQMMHEEATKLRAVAALAAHWGFTVQEVAAFGDDLNDVDMLRGCGVGVAMGNALPEVFAAANEVTATNNEDGLAQWVERRLLL